MKFQRLFFRGKNETKPHRYPVTQFLRVKLQFLQITKRVALEPTCDSLHCSNFFENSEHF